MDFSFLSGIFASPWDILRNIIDIAIIAYVFYRILGLIRGSRAEQLLKGLIILLVFSVAASLLHLEMVNWLLEKAWIVFAIALPIVFQPELRRLLRHRSHYVQVATAIRALLSSSLLLLLRFTAHYFHRYLHLFRIALYSFR